MTKKCPKCQAENPDTKSFCGDCGTQLDVDVSQTRTLETPTDQLTRGSTFADRYEIIEELGRGGMGRVYRVEDTKAREEIALKVIKPEISADKKTIERFRNELNITRKIRHKNVCGMYDLGEADNTYYITMEYVSGEDLKTLIRRVKHLAVGSCISIAKQICEGLTEAHKLGIVHRDLKPSNIMIDKNGDVRIMDFGIARSMKTKGITGTGMMIGTPEYMSPEQVEAKDIDQRSDIYSLGIILYEMLTGRIPFEGDTAFAVGLKHKGEEPEDPRIFNSNIPEDLSFLILKCLEKDKENRFIGAEELGSELTRIEGLIPTSDRVTPKRKTKTSKEITVQFSLKKLYIPLIALIAVAAVVFLSLFLLKKTASKTPIPTLERQLTFTGHASRHEISPDGNFIAYINQESFDEYTLNVQDIVSGNTIEVFRSPGIYNLRWTPDSSEICIAALGSDSKYGLLFIPRLGGTPRTMTYFPIVAFSPDGSQYAGTFNDWKAIRIVERTTGDTKNISLEKDSSFLSDLDWSPNGHQLLFRTRDNEKNTIWTINIDGSNPQRALEDNRGIMSPRWSPEGDSIFYIRGGHLGAELWSVQISPDTGLPAKPPSLVLSDHHGPFFSLSRDGKKLAFPKVQTYINFWILDLASSEDSTPKDIQSLTTGTSLNTAPSISPDGTQIVFRRAVGGQEDLYVMPIEGGTPTQITLTKSGIRSPAWSPDGQQIAYLSYESGEPKVWKVSAQGGKSFQFSNTEFSTSTPQLIWAPGSNILYLRPGNRNMHLLDPETGEETPLLPDESKGFVFTPRYSPDGRKVAVAWNRTDEFGRGIWVISLDDSSQVLVKKGIYLPIGWSPDGQWIYIYETVKDRIKILMFEIESGEERLVAEVPIRFELGRPSGLYMSPDAQKFIFPISVTNSDAWLIENLDEIRKQKR